MVWYRFLMASRGAAAVFPLALADTARGGDRRAFRQLCLFQHIVAIFKPYRLTGHRPGVDGWHDAGERCHSERAHAHDAADWRFAEVFQQQLREISPV